MARALAVSLLALSAAGCLPDLGRWQVIPAGTDGGPPVVTDGGGPATPNPIDLGPPCPSPHLLVGTTASSSDDARVIRIDPSTGVQCRTSALLEVQRAFGFIIRDVDWHPEVGEILGLQGAVLALDGEGFPRWRYQPFDDSSFDASYVVANGAGANLRIGAFWQSGTSSLSDMLLLDGGGNPRSGAIELPFGGTRMASAHPDGSGRWLMASSAGPIRAYTIGDSTISFRTEDGVEIFPSTWDPLLGSRNHLDADQTTNSLTMAHQEGVLLWTGGGATPPSAVYRCPSQCTNYSVATPGPASDVFALCGALSGSSRHLVRMTGGDACTIVLDGTALGGRSLGDVTLVRAPL